VLRIAAAVPAGALLMPGDIPSIKEMAGMLEHCRLFVGNDSGPMHIAAALGVPTVAIFGPGSPALTGPAVPAGCLSVVDKRYPCSPCRQDFFRECPAAPSGKPFCLEEIEVEEVVSAALRLLAASPDH
jgi:ADP-heptose:LPS heptosyltransferase